jgi:DNA-binding CsgD family transcriptional regulator
MNAKRDETCIPLSPAMLCALGALSQGKQRRQIAYEMGISYNTLNVHLRDAYRRLGVVNAAGAVSCALRRGLIVR